MIIHVVNEISRDVRPGSRGGYMRLVISENVWRCFIGCSSKIYLVPSDMPMQRSDRWS